MAGRTPDEALRNSIDPIRRAVGFICPEQLSVVTERRHQVGSEVNLSLNAYQPVRLRTLQRGDLWLTMASRLRIIEAEGDRGPFRTTVVGYEFALHESPDLSRELLAYHWTPEAVAPRRSYPHIHVGSCLLIDSYKNKHWSFNKLHLRSDRVSFEGFILMLIEEFGVKTRSRDWGDRLRDGNAIFTAYRTK